MAQERKDGWTPEDDAVLAETVLKHIREGSTQLAAFDEAGERLERTAGACGFRWNSEVRKRHEDEIRRAKAVRRESKSGKAAKPAAQLFVSVSQVNIDDPGDYAHDYLEQILQLANKQKLQLANMTKQIKQLGEQLSEKAKEVEQLKRQLDEARNVPTEVTVNEDYRTLLQILQRARQIGAIDEENREKHLFKMDASGNIEFVG